MSLFKKLLGGKSAASAAPASRFQDSQPERTSSRSVPRREVVHVVLRDTLRRHGIPLDWLECRTLSLVQSNRSTGTYVTLIVKRGQERLLPHVPALQTSFRQALERFDPKATEWLRGMAWQFEDAASAKTLPDAAGWREAAPSAAAAASGAAASSSGQAAAPAASSDEDLQADLRALFAIRDAALGEGASEDGFKPTERGSL